MLNNVLIDLLREGNVSPLDLDKTELVTTDVIEDQLILAAKSGGLSFVNECDVLQFASLDYVSSDSVQLQKLQARSLIRRPSADSQLHGATGEFIRFSSLFRNTFHVQNMIFI